MVHPTPGYDTTAAFWQRGRYWSLSKDANGYGRHTGTDFGAPIGTPILAMTHGTVIAANVYDESYGYKVIIRFDGFDYWYCHMPNRAAVVDVGDRVEAGQMIGRVGATGNVSGAHLHVEKRVAGRGFAVESFRDPMVAVLWQPPQIRYESINISDDNTTGKATRNLRRGRLLTDIFRPGADYILFQEAPKDGIYQWLTANINRRPRGRRQGHRPIAGASGRRMWAGKRVDHRDHGKIVPSVRGEGGREQPFTWTYDVVDGYRPRLVVNVHGPFGIPGKQKRKYWDEVLAWVDRKRRGLGLEWWQVVIGGDFNTRGPALRAAKRYGLVDAMSLAPRKGRKHRLFKSTNSWRRRLIPGKRIDFFLVPKRGVQVLEVRNTKTRWNRKKTHTVTDHNRQILITR